MGFAATHHLCSQSHQPFHPDVSTQRNQIAYHVTAIYLKKIEQQIDPKNKEHERMFNIALKDTPLKDLPVEDRKAALQMKSLKVHLYDYSNKAVDSSVEKVSGLAQATPVTLIQFAGLALQWGKGFLKGKADPITVEEIKFVYPGPLSPADISEIRELNKSKEAESWFNSETEKDTVQYEQELKETEVKMSADLASATSEKKEISETGKQPFSDSPPSDKEKNLGVTGNPQSQKTEGISTETHEKDYFLMGLELAGAVAEGAAKLARVSLSSAQKESRRAELSAQFDRLNKAFSLDLNEAQFHGQNYNLIFQNVHQLIYNASITNKAALIKVYTEEFCSRAETLRKNISHYAKQKDDLKNRKTSLAEIDRQIKDFYDSRLKRLNMKSNFWGVTQAAFSTAASVAFCLDQSKLVAGGLATLASIASLPAMACEKKMHKLTTQYQGEFGKSQEAHHFVEWMEAQSSQALTFYQQQTLQHADLIISQGHFLRPPAMRKELADTLVLCNTNIENANQSIKANEIKTTKRNKQLNSLNKEKRELERKKTIKEFFKEKFPNEDQKRLSEVAREIELINTELTGLSEASKNSQETILQQEKAVKQVEYELRKANYLAPLADAGDAFLEEALSEYPSVENQAINQEFADRYAERREHHERFFRLRMAVAQAASPIASELDFWTGTNIPSELLKLVVTTDQLIKNFGALNDFIKTASPILNCGNSTRSTTSEPRATFPHRIDFTLLNTPPSDLEGLDRIRATVEALDWQNLTTLAVNAFGVMSSSLIICHTLYSIYNWRKNVPLTVTINQIVLQCQQNLEIRLNTLEDRLKDNHQELKERIAVLRKDLKEAKYEILHAVSHVHRRVEETGDDTLHRQYIMNLGRVRDEMGGSGVEKGLVRCTQVDVNGADFDLSKRGVDFLHYMAQNPLCYSGLIYNLMFQDKTFPNLFLFDFVVYRIVKTEKKDLKSDQVQTALKQFERIEKLFEFPQELIFELVEIQEALFQTIREQCANVAQFKENVRVQQTQKTLEALDISEFNLDKKAGWSKFALNRLAALPIQDANVKSNVGTVLTSYPLHTVSKASITLSEAEGKKYRSIISSLQTNNEYWIQYILSDASTLEIRDISEITPHSKNELYSAPTALQKTLFAFKAVFSNQSNKLRIAFTPDGNGVLKENDLATIAANCTVKENCEEKEYTQALNQLVNDYAAFLKNKTNVPADHPFALLKTEGQLLKGKDDALIPLVFPKSLLKEIESTVLLRDLFFIEATGIGTLLPTSYDLHCLPNSSSYQLSIRYDLIPQSQEEKPEYFCEVVIADFDKRVVHSFAEVDITEESIAIKELYFNELLIQSFYCGFDTTATLGIPGNGTYRLAESPAVAPRENRSSGLYKLFTEKPGQKQNLDVDTGYSKTFSIHYNIELFFKIQHETHVKMKQFEELAELDLYRRKYYLLLSCLKLQTAARQSEIKEMLHYSLNLKSPESTEFMYLEVMSEKVSPALKPDVMSLEQFLLNNPSEMKSILDTHLANLDQLALSLEGEHRPNFRSYNRVSEWLPI